MNPYIRYYQDQVGSGLVGFEGVKYQKGHGFFGRLISSFAKPLLSYFGKKALSTGRDIASDLLEGKNIKESVKTRAKETLKKVGEDSLEYGKRKLSQVGSGMRCKRRRITNKKNKNKKRKIKRKKLTTKRKTKAIKGRAISRHSIVRRYKPSTKLDLYLR